MLTSQFQTAPVSTRAMKLGRLRSSLHYIPGMAAPSGGMDDQS